MASDFELNLPGLNELMKSPEMQAVLTQAGNAVASAAGGDYGVRTHVASFVAIANVYPDSAKAAKDNFENNTLVKALGAAGLTM
jgi:hypothetical protein